MQPPELIELRDSYTVEQARLLEAALHSTAKMVLSAEEFLHSMALVDKEGQREQLVTEKDTQGSKVFAGILTHGARAVSHLTRGYETLDLSLASWAGRNLVELRIWSRYASMSLETMRRFHDDSILDTLELAQLSQRALTAGNAGPEAIAEAEAEIREINSKLQQSTITIAKRLQIKVICKDVGAEQYYKTWFGMLSKFAHPTPGLVIEVETGKEIISDEVLQPIFVMGLRSATELLNTTIQSMQFVETAEQAKFS